MSHPLAATIRVAFRPMPAPDSRSRVFPPGPNTDDRKTVVPPAGASR